MGRFKFNYFIFAVAIILFHGNLFAQDNVSLPFKGRYNSIEEIRLYLDEFKPVDIQDLKTWRHEFSGINEKYSTYLRSEIPYATKDFNYYFDENNRPWLHFMIEGDKKAYVKSSVKSVQRWNFSKKMSLSYDFSFKSSSKTPHFLMTRINVAYPQKEASVFKIMTKYGKIHVQINDQPMKESIEHNHSTDVLYLGEYEQGKIENIKIEFDGRDVTIFYKDNTVQYHYENLYGENENYNFTLKLGAEEESKEKYFAEAYLKDIIYTVQ